MKTTTRHFLHILLYIACIIVITFVVFCVIGGKAETAQEIIMLFSGCLLVWFLFFKVMSRVVGILVEKKKERLEKLGEKTEETDDSELSVQFRKSGFDMLVRPVLKREYIPHIIMFFLSLVLISILMPPEGTLEIVLLVVGFIAYVVSFFPLYNAIREAAMPGCDEDNDRKDDANGKPKLKS